MSLAKEIVQNPSSASRRSALDPSRALPWHAGRHPRRNLRRARELGNRLWLSASASRPGFRARAASTRPAGAEASHLFGPAPSTQAVDIPKYYANWDEEFWVLAPTPDKTYEITLAYNKQPDTITDTTSSPAPATAGTYLSNNYQDLLLYACLVNTYAYLKGPQDMLQYYQGAYEKALYSYAIEQQGRRRRDEYADGVIRTVLASENPSSNK